MKIRTFFVWQFIALAWVLALGVFPSMAEVFHVSDSGELHVALETSQANGEADTIYLAAGTYSPHPFSHFVYLSEEGLSLTIQGEPGTSPETVILSGGGDRQILHIYDRFYSWPPPEPMGKISLIGLTFRDSADLHDTPVRLEGGMIDFTVQNCRFYDNVSNIGKGGAIYIGAGYSNVTFENNRVENNQVNEREITSEGRRFTISKGGGVYISSAGLVTNIRNNIIANNRAQGDLGIGGGLYVEISCPTFVALNLIHNTIVNNSAGLLSGGVYLEHLAGAAPANLYNNIIYGNVASIVPETNDFWAYARFNDIYAVNNDLSLNPVVIGVFNPPEGSFGNFEDDPDLTPGTYFFDTGSPVYDAGTFSVPVPGLPETDLLGNPRVCGSAPDLGAYELCEAGWPPAPRPIINLGIRSLVMMAKRKSLLPIKIALLPPQWNPNDNPVDANSPPIFFEEDNPENQREWWIFLKKAGGAGLPGNSWYLGSQGWSTKPVPYKVAAQYLYEETKIGTLCPADLKLKNGLYEIWFGVDREADGKINPSTLTAQGMYLKVGGNPMYPPPVPRLPEWVRYRALLNKVRHLKK